MVYFTTKHKKCQILSKVFGCKVPLLGLGIKLFFRFHLTKGKNLSKIIIAVSERLQNHFPKHFCKN